jgi:hypothetical protein
MATRHKRREGELEFRLLMAATLPAFFVAILAKRALPWNWGRDKRPLFQATRTAAHNTIPFAFM